MKKEIIVTGSALAIMASLFLGCSESTAGPGNSYQDPVVADTVYTDVLNVFAKKVVVPTLADMSDKAGVLHEKAKKLQSEPSDSALKEVADAWRTVRVPWESSESFLFGPVAFLGLDPSLDSWPLDKSQLENVLSSNHVLDEGAIELLGSTVRGFHTAEYLIFEAGKEIPIDSISDRELEYLVAITSIIASNSADLHNAWSTGEYEGGAGAAYQDEFKNAGKVGSRYQSQKAAFDEIIEGMLGIIDEVAAGKLGDPASENDPTLVESQFSYNSLSDFQDNLRSVQNAYLGFYHLEEERVEAGLTDWVKARNEALDIKLKKEIQASIDAIAAIKGPFRDNLDDENIDVAIEAMQSLAESIGQIKTLN